MTFSSAGYTAGNSFLFATKVTKATRGHEGTSKELLCDQWQEISYFVPVVMMTQYADRWYEKWVTCCVLGGLERLQDQLPRQKEAAEQKLDPQLNYNSVPAVKVQI